MNKTKKTKNPIWFALAANAATLIVALFAYRPFFEENDDAFLAMIAEGAYGMSEVRLIYVNVILGYLYRFLYSVAPMVRWHSVLQYVFIFMAFTAFTYVIMAICIKRKTEKIAKPLSIVFLLAMAYEGYVSLQYSKTATITASAGFLILLYSLRRRDDKDDVTVSRKELNILDAIAYLLIFYAMLLRDSSFMLAGLLTVPLGLAEFVKSLKAGKGKALARYVFTFLPVLIFLVVFMKVDRIAYNRDASWKSFMEYNDTRMQLLDYRYDLLDYNMHSSRLDKAGISANDAFMYLTWQFGDDTVLTTAKMEEVLSGAPGRWTPVTCLKALTAHVYEDLLIFNPLVLGLLLILTYILLTCVKNMDRSGAFFLVPEFVVFSAVLVYYEYCGRWSHRIVYAAMLGFFMQLVCMAAFRSEAHNDHEKRSGRVLNMAAMGIVFFVACLTVLAGNRLDYNDYLRTGTEYHALFDSLKEDKDTLYIADTFTFQEAYKYDVFRPYEKGSLDNFVAVGSWFVNSPVTREITEAFGFKNPFLALTGKPAKGKQVLLIDNMYLDEKLKFFEEHYGKARADASVYRHGFKLSHIKIGN